MLALVATQATAAITITSANSTRKNIEVVGQSCPMFSSLNIDDNYFAENGDYLPSSIESHSGFGLFTQAANGYGASHTYLATSTIHTVTLSSTPIYNSGEWHLVTVPMAITCSAWSGNGGSASAYMNVDTFGQLWVSTNNSSNSPDYQADTTSVEVSFWVYFTPAVDPYTGQPIGKGTLQFSTYAQTSASGQASNAYSGAYAEDMYWDFCIQ